MTSFQRTFLVLALSATLLGGCASGRNFCDPASCPEGTECDPDLDRCVAIACTPGFTRCAPSADGSIERCNAQGDGYLPVGACSTGQSCVDESSGGYCDPPLCAAGSSRCDIGGAISYCVVGTYENPVDCPTGEACDPALGSGCTETECAPETLFCEADAAVVRLCNAYGTGSSVVETCAAGDECRYGTCVSLCDIAELERSFIGCRYYAVDLDNEEHDDPLQYDIVVSNPHPPGSGVVAHVTIETRSGAGGSWAPVASDAVAPATVRIFALPDRHVEGSTLAIGLAYRVSSDVPIVAYQFNSDDLNGAAGSSGATILLPKPALEDFYYVMSLPAATGNDSLFTFGGRMHASGLAVVGTEDGTTVTVTSATNTVGGAGIPGLSAGNAFTTTLNEGDVLQIESLGLGDDVSGSTVVSDAPVAVFGSHECAVLESPTCDHIEEQMLPLTAWGTTFANTRIAHGNAQHLWRILASEDDTTVTFEYEVGVGGLPQPSGSSVVMDAGEIRDFYVTGPVSGGGGSTFNGNIGDFYTFSDKPIYIVQISTYEPDMVTSIPVDQWLPEYVFIAPPFFADVLTITRSMASTVTLDGVPIPTGEWSTIAAGYQAHRRPLEDGSHRITGVAPSELQGPPEIYVSGEDYNCGYAYVGGLNVAVINPIR